MSKLQELIKELCPDGVEFSKLGEVCEIFSGKNKQKNDEGEYPVYGSTGIIAYCDNYKYSKEQLLIARVGANAGFTHIAKGKYDVSDNTLIVDVIGGNCLKYIYYLLVNLNLNKYSKGGGQPLVTAGEIKVLEIPLPPLEVQNEIVRILDTFTSYAAELQAELQARKEQYEYYRNKLLTFDENIKHEKLNTLVSFMNGKGHEKCIEDGGKYIVVNSKFISTNGEIKKYSNIQISPLFKGMILMVMSDLPNGKALAKCFIVDKDDKYTLNQRIGAFCINNTNLIITRFLYYILNRNTQLLAYDNGVDQTNLRKGDILNILIPVPPLSEQQRIVSILDKFESLVNDLTTGLPAEIAAVQEQYEYYRNKLLSFKRIS